jgi:methionyl-tRNA formyltransferase
VRRAGRLVDARAACEWPTLGGRVRVLFYGTPAFAVPTLEALVAAGHTVVGVVAQPDKPVGRGQQVAPPPVAQAATRLGLPLMQPVAIRSGDFPVWVEGLEADVAVVLAYGRILTRRLLDAPRHGCVNVHASLLPRWRGAAPIQAAILAGDAVTGVCTQRMEEGLDTGDVYDALSTPIGRGETAGQLHDRLMALSAQIAVQTLSRLPDAVPTPQAEHGVCWAPKIEKADGAIDWSVDAPALARRVWAMTPWPGGFVTTPSGPLKLLDVDAVDAHGPPGAIVSLDPLTVAAASGALVLRTVQAAGRKPVAGSDYARGARLTVGERLA